ncbi:hypothetical protein ZWY2020_043331 [Hordeum vulgare]|nr:hypothetical protein ZWY2020_043331 [Hordeum vulgare]
MQGVMPLSCGQMRVSSDEARRRGNGNPDNGRETTWKGLVSNDIYYIWNHGPKFGGGFNCRYCSLISRGGGATRFREHLGGIPGEVRECPNVPRNVRAAMRDSRDDARQKKREKKNRRLRLERDIMEGLYHGEGVINIEDDDEQIQTVLRESLRDKNVSRAVERRRGSGSGVRVSLGKQSITTYFDKELSALEWVLAMLEPLYKALRYADTQKRCTLSGFKKSMMAAIQKLESHLGGGSQMFHRVMSKVSKRIDAMQEGTLLVAAAVLDPYTHYQINMSNITDYASALTDAIEKIADPETAVLAIDEVSTYRECRGRFGQRLARSSAEKMSPRPIKNTKRNPKICIHLRPFHSLALPAAKTTASPNWLHLSAKARARSRSARLALLVCSASSPATAPRPQPPPPRRPQGTRMAQRRPRGSHARRWAGSARRFSGSSPALRPRPSASSSTPQSAPTFLHSVDPRVKLCSGVSRVFNEDEDFMAQMWKPINIQLMQHKFYGIASKNDRVLI